MDNQSKAELLSRVKHDQSMRRGELEWDDSVDIANSQYLQGLINTFGLPTLLDNGDEVVQATWLLAQHADHDPILQTHCLKLMKNMPEGEVNLAHIAFLEDRIRVNNKKPQIYGTQFYKDGDYFGPHPIEDIAKLDERRLSMRMEAFAEYEALMRQLHE